MADRMISQFPELKIPNSDVFYSVIDTSESDLSLRNKKLNYNSIAFEWQKPIKGFVDTLPTTPSEGDRYILNSDNKIYQYDGSSWVAIGNGAGWSVYNIADGKVCAFNGTDWSLDYNWWEEDTKTLDLGEYTFVKPTDNKGFGRYVSDTNYQIFGHKPNVAYPHSAWRYGNHLYYIDLSTGYYQTYSFENGSYNKWVNEVREIGKSEYWNFYTIGVWGIFRSHINDHIFSSRDNYSGWGGNHMEFSSVSGVGKIKIRANTQKGNPSVWEGGYYKKIYKDSGTRYCDTGIVTDKIRKYWGDLDDTGKTLLTEENGSTFTDYRKKFFINNSSSAGHSTVTELRVGNLTFEDTSQYPTLTNTTQFLGRFNYYLNQSGTSTIFDSTKPCIFMQVGAKKDKSIFDFTVGGFNFDDYTNTILNIRVRNGKLYLPNLDSSGEIKDRSSTQEIANIFFQEDRVYFQSEAGTIYDLTNGDLWVKDTAYDTAGGTVNSDDVLKPKEAVMGLEFTSKNASGDITYWMTRFGFDAHYLLYRKGIDNDFVYYKVATPTANHEIFDDNDNYIHYYQFIGSDYQHRYYKGSSPTQNDFMLDKKITQTSYFVKRLLKDVDEANYPEYMENGTIEEMDLSTQTAKRIDVINPGVSSYSADITLYKRELNQTNREVNYTYYTDAINYTIKNADTLEFSTEEFKYKKETTFKYFDYRNNIFFYVPDIEEFEGGYNFNLGLNYARVGVNATDVSAPELLFSLNENNNDYRTGFESLMKIYLKSDLNISNYWTPTFQISGKAARGVEQLLFKVKDGKLYLPDLNNDGNIMYSLDEDVANIFIQEGQPYFQDRNGITSPLLCSTNVGLSTKLFRQGDVYNQNILDTVGNASYSAVPMPVKNANGVALTALKVVIGQSSGNGSETFKFEVWTVDLPDGGISSGIDYSYLSSNGTKLTTLTTSAVNGSPMYARSYEFNLNNFVAQGKGVVIAIIFSSSIWGVKDVVAQLEYYKQ